MCTLYQLIYLGCVHLQMLSWQRMFDITWWSWCCVNPILFLCAWNCCNLLCQLNAKTCIFLVSSVALVTPTVFSYLPRLHNYYYCCFPWDLEWSVWIASITFPTFCETSTYKFQSRFPGSRFPGRAGLDWLTVPWTSQWNSSKTNHPCIIHNPLSRFTTDANG